MGSELSRTQAHLLDQYRTLESKSTAVYERWITAWKVSELPNGNTARTMDIHQYSSATSSSSSSSNTASSAPDDKTDDELHDFLAEMEAHGAAMCKTASRFFTGGNCTLNHGTTFNIHQNGSITSIFPIYQGGYRVIRKYRDGKFVSESKRVIGS